MDVQFLHCETKWSPRMINVQSIRDSIKQCVYTIQVRPSSSRGQQSCHSMLYTGSAKIAIIWFFFFSTDIWTTEVASLLRNYFAKVRSRSLNLHPSLIHINHVPGVDIISTVWTLPVPKYVPFMQVYCPVHSLIRRRRGLRSKAKELFCPGDRLLKIWSHNLWFPVALFGCQCPHCQYCSMYLMQIWRLG